MPIQDGVSLQWRAVERALDFVIGGDGSAFESRRKRFERRTVETVHGKVDAEALLDAVDEFLAEFEADISHPEGFAPLRDRRHGIDTEVTLSVFDADDRFSGPDRIGHGHATRRNVIAKYFRQVSPV